MKLSIKNSIYQAIIHNKWLDISYLNKKGESTTYYIGIKDIDVEKGTIVCDIFNPFKSIATIPPCVMGGVCIALYGFIAVSGLKMIQPLDLGDNKNLFVVSSILIAGIGGLTLVIGKVTITSIACALILGILINIVVNLKKNKEVKE